MCVYRRRCWKHFIKAKILDLSRAEKVIGPEYVNCMEKLAVAAAEYLTVL